MAAHTNTLLVVLVVVVAVQGGIPSWETLMNALEQRIHQLQERIEAAATGSVDNPVGRMVQRVRQEFLEARDTTQRFVENVALSVGQQVAEVQRQAEATGVAVQECVEGREEQMQQVVNQLAVDSHQCGEQAKQAAEPSIEASQQLIQDARDIVNATRINVIECDHSITCFATVAVKLNAGMAGVVTRIDPVVEAAMPKLEAIGQLLMQCQGNATQQAHNNIVAVGKQAVQCIKDKAGQQ